MQSPVTTSQKHFRIAANRINFRAASDSTPATVEGHAAVFNTLSTPLYELGGACEMLMPGCFADSISEPDTVKLLINHDSNLVLASYPGTLSLREDEIGLWFSATLPNTSYGNDLAESMRRGDLGACSFAFSIDAASMEMVAGQPCQVVRSVELSDVSIVAFPAYPQTSVALRNHYQDLVASLKNNPGINSQVKEIAGAVSSTAAMDSFARRKREIELLAVR